MLRRLCNVIVRWLLPHSDLAMAAGEHTRALAILELAQVLAHTHDALAFLGTRPGQAVIRHLPVEWPGVAP